MLYTPGFLGGSVWGSVLGGTGDVGSSDTWGPFYGRIPIPVAGTFRNMTAYSGESRAADSSLTLYVNGIATTLTLTLPAAVAQSFNPLDRIPVLPGDDVLYRWGGTFVGAPGLHMGATIEFEGQQSIYGISPVQGTITAGTGWIGGALGNGIFQSIASVPIDGAAGSNTYSICSTPGHLTRMVLKELGSTATGGSWTAYLRVNGILQDGSPGTTDTTLNLADGGNFAIGTFALALDITDHVDAVVIRNTNTSPFSGAHVGLAVAFTPQTSGDFIICGGNNNAITNDYDLYTWVESGQLVADEPLAAVPCSISGYVARGLYVEFVDPEVGSAWVARLRLNGLDTLATVTVLPGFNRASIAGLFIPVGSGKLMDILIHAIGEPATGQFHWSLATAASGVPVGNIGPIAWLDRTRRQP